MTNDTHNTNCPNCGGFGHVDAGCDDQTQTTCFGCGGTGTIETEAEGGVPVVTAEGGERRVCNNGMLPEGSEAREALEALIAKWGEKRELCVARGKDGATYSETTQYWMKGRAFAYDMVLHDLSIWLKRLPND